LCTLSVLQACVAQTQEQIEAAEEELRKAQREFSPRGKMSARERRQNKAKVREQMRLKLLNPEDRLDTGFAEVDPPDFMSWNGDDLFPKDLGLDWRFMSDHELSRDEKDARLVVLVDKMAHLVTKLTQKVQAMENAILETMLDEIESLESETIQLNNVMDAAVGAYNAHTQLIEAQIKDMMHTTLTDHRTDVKDRLEPLRQVHHGWLTPFIVLALVIVALLFGLVSYHGYLVKKHVL